MNKKSRHKIIEKDDKNIVIVHTDKFTLKHFNEILDELKEKKKKK